MSYADEHIRAKIADIENRLKQKEADLLNRINHPKKDDINYHNNTLQYEPIQSYITGMAYPNYLGSTFCMTTGVCNTMGYHNSKL